MNLSDGSSVAAPIGWNADIGWGVARFELPDGVEILSNVTTDTSPPVDGTAFGGYGGMCSSSVTRDTLYLGGPGWANNQAADGFMLSLPSGPSATEVAGTFVSQAIIGGGCEEQISAALESDLGGGRSVVSIVAVPPAAPADMQFTLETLETDGVIGVTAVQGATTFEVVNTGEVPALRLLDVPSIDAVSVSVRFRKGDDVWELMAGPTADAPIALVVPAVETDQFPEAQPEWVLFTVRDGNGAVLDAGGAQIP